MNRLFRRVLASVTIASAAAASAVTLAAPAQAAFSDCQDGQFCVYLNEDGTGLKGVFRLGTLDIAQQRLPDAKSAINKTGQVVRLYEATGLAGPSDPVEAKRNTGFSLADVNGNNWLGKVRSIQVGNWDPKAATPPDEKPASAAGYDRCKDGEFCVFAENNGGGAYATFRKGADDLSRWALDGKAKSAWNRSGKQVTVYAAKSAGGEQKTITTSDKIELASLGWQSKIRSVRVGEQALVTQSPPTTTVTTAAPAPVMLTSTTMCGKSQRGDSTCARYDQRDGGVVDIEYKSSLTSYAPTTFKGEVGHKDGARVAEGTTEARSSGIFRTTVKVGKQYSAGAQLCAKVLEVKPGVRQWGEVCLPLRADDNPKPGMAEPAAVNPAAWPCEPSSFCVYANYNGAGSHWALQDGADLSAISGMLNDHVFAVKNIDNEDWCLYADKEQKSKVIVVPAGQSYNLKTVDATRISSVDDDC